MPERCGYQVDSVVYFSPDYMHLSSRPLRTSRENSSGPNRLHVSRRQDLSPSLMIRPKVLFTLSLPEHSYPVAEGPSTERRLKCLSKGPCLAPSPSLWALRRQQGISAAVLHSM